MNEALTRFTETFGPDALADLVFRWAPGALSAVVTAAIFYLLYRATGGVLKRTLERVNFDRTGEALVITVVRTAIAVVGIITVLNQLGVDTTSILASLGVLGLTLGFAAQNTLSNVISGLFIFWDRPFVIGDLVEIDGEYGRIEAITLRSTRLVTPDGRMIAIPNAAVAEAKVASYTNFPHLRIDIDVTVGVNESIDRCRELLLGIVAGDERYMTEPEASVAVTNLGDYNVTLVLSAWLDDEKKHVAARAELREAVYKTFTEAGVDMPFETVQIQPITVESRPAA